MEGGVCPTCLSRGRSLQPLHHVAPAYTALLAGLQPNDQLEHFATFSLVCWECISFLRKVLRFQTQALHANMLLQSYSDSVKDVSYSPLGSFTKIGVDMELEWTGHDVLEDLQWEEPTVSDETLAQVKVELEATSGTKDVVPDVRTEKKWKARSKKEARNHKVKRNARNKVITITLSEHEMQRYRDEDRENEQYLKAPYKCETCIKGFIFPGLLERHNISKHNQDSTHQCDICRECFTSPEPLTRHMRKHYSLYRCESCEYSARSLADVQRHMAEHGPSETLPCNECGAHFTTKRKLRYHKESAHKEAVKCELCGKVMINRYSLKHHMLTHTGMPTYECSICHKVYRGEAGLYSHMRLFHSSDPSETYCAQCDIHFKNKTIYRSHLKRSPKHATPDQLKFACEKCPKRFISEASLRKHHRYYHLDYVCHICQKRLKNWFSLDNHIKFVHERREMPRKHMCETCGKGFKTKTMLSNHQTTHSGERPHACDLCGAAFSVKASLRTHRRHVHMKLPKPAPVTHQPLYQYSL